METGIFVCFILVVFGFFVVVWLAWVFLFVLFFNKMVFFPQVSKVLQILLYIRKDMFSNSEHCQLEDIFQKTESSSRKENTGTAKFCRH